ncbi:hypothetical protein MMB17_07515 [Methylobacterium organophilum]|uniref:phage baseplate assembly protein n=1 Tax=Methylobacterium organophilum TaxID=410 RepID=UPI001F134ECE|nr:hypothetical protein [Methylobacterium organophilum]UMY19138.1 hypothetical protein MMB17_07515 [Methylobacterium organophilum]
MPQEIVTISVGGTPYTAFESVSVTAEFDAAARSFEATIAAEFGPGATHGIFAAGSEVTIASNGDLLLTGYVDAYRPSLTASSASIGISGRSKSQDAIDCSADHKTGRIEKKDPVAIAKELANGIAVEIETDQQLEKVEAYQHTPGETLFRCLERLARKQGCTVTGTAEGGMKVTKAGSKRHAGGLIEGVNLLVGDANHDWSNRHSSYTVRGQRAAGHGKGALELEAKVRDAAVGRHRPVIVIQEDDTDEKTVKKRAETRRDRAAGNALSATITTQGFRDQAGKLWEPGYLVWVESPFLSIMQDMLIKSVNFSKDGEGSKTRLELCDPRAFGGKAGKGNKSGSSWGLGGT